MAELRHYTSLRVGGPAKKFVDAHNEKEIVAAIEAAGDSPILIIGGGTNILVADGGFDGTVIRITNKSLEAEIDACSGATLSIGAGENWDDFVKSTITRGFAGLETLSGIPGSVGASPIQNIGAYGVEQGDCFDSLSGLPLNGPPISYSKETCAFGYRNSIFKQELKNNFVITRVRYLLSTQPRPRLEYQDLKLRFEKSMDQAAVHHPSSDEIAKAVADIILMSNTDWDNILEINVKTFRG